MLESPLGRWAVRIGRPAFLHRLVQYALLLFYGYVAVLFYLYALWAMGESSAYTAKPPSVEAFLPISALLGAKRLVYTGQYDVVHPAGLTILLLAFAVSFLLRKGFCGYLCPVGGLSAMLHRLGRKLGVTRSPGRVASAVLGLPKYALLIFFVDLVLWNMGLDDIEAFIRTPYNMVADTKMLLFFLRPTTTLLVLIGVLLLGSLMIPGFWCRGFCPYGALLGLCSLFSPVAVNRDTSTCTGCRSCARACPSGIPVHKKKRVSSPDCVGCTECVGACPEKGCLTVRIGFTAHARAVPFWLLPAGTVLVLGLFYGWAVMTGHWTSGIPPEAMRMFHDNILQMQHP